MERNTTQRMAIRRVFDREHRPLTPHEILAKARDDTPKLGIATVYRHVKALVDEGELHAVELPGEGLRYERSGKEHHHHFHCKVCGRVFEMEGCPDGLTSLVPAGFVMEEHEVYIYGRCRACTEAGAA